MGLRYKIFHFSSESKHEYYPWLTLVTCKGYKERIERYSYRVIVRAILVEAK